ncbi:MAG: 2TM domain-containing protein, partial [Aggregatilineales bacterium]
FFTGAGFPWPFMVLFGWGAGIFAHGMEYYNEYGAGARRVEETYQRELEEEMRRSGLVDDKEKNKDKRRYDEGVPARLTDMPVTPVRLNEDGELTDSFVEDQQRRGSY